MTNDPPANNAQQANVFDIGVEKLAAVYAQAGLDAAGEASAQGKLVEELKALVEEVLDRFPELEQIFSTALISDDDKDGILDRLFASQLSTLALNLLKVLAKHGRLGILRAVVRSADSLWDERSGRVPVELQFAMEVDELLCQEVTRALQATLGSEPMVTTVVNPDLIAGFVVRVEDRVYDASARTSFERARAAMVARAMDAIQGNPDQFSTSEE